MPDARAHRGAHPQDADLFAPSHWPALQAASRDLYWLLDRGYALRSSLALVGDRHALTQRQRLAVARCACSREQHDHRASHEVAPSTLAGHELWIDGYNLLITLESALAGAVVLRSRDTCLRDMASLHGTYREVAETGRAAELIGYTAATWSVAKCRWLLDRPVGNSGRLKSALLDIAAAHHWSWEVELAFSPDKLLAGTAATVVTSDSVVLDRCSRWCNVARWIIAAHIPNARIVDLASSASLA